MFVEDYCRPERPDGLICSSNEAASLPSLAHMRLKIPIIWKITDYPGGGERKENICLSI